MQANNTKETELTPAQKLGYKVGDLFEVIEDASYSCKGMIVKFDTDDNSTFHWFTYESGPKATFTDSVNEVLSTSLKSSLTSKNKYNLIRNLKYNLCTPLMKSKQLCCMLVLLKAMYKDCKSC
jgi:hypothetical protein